MPPKTRFTEDAILDAAFELLREEGLHSLSARHIAERAGSSTAPVYSAFASMDEVKHALVARVFEALHEYTTRAWTPGRFLNMGVGIAVFAREEPMLFRAVFLESNEFRAEIDAFHERLVNDMEQDTRFTVLTHDQRMALLLRMAVITYGLATMVSVGLFEDDSDAGIIDWLNHVGTAVIHDEIVRLEASHALKM